MVAAVVGVSSALSPSPAIAADGPVNIPNSAIADRAEQYPDGTSYGQCLVFALGMIHQAGGPQWYFGNNTGTYQSQWSQHAAPVSSIAAAQRGDIIQWGGGAGGSELHTAIVTQPGSNPSIIDSNWNWSSKVYRGSFSSRNLSGSVYRIWRVGKGSNTGGIALPALGPASTTFDPNNNTTYMAVQAPGNTLALYWNVVGQPIQGPLYASAVGQDIGPPSITYVPSNNTLYMAAQGAGNTLTMYWDGIGQAIQGPLPSGNGQGTDAGPPSIAYDLSNNTLYMGAQETGNTLALYWDGIGQAIQGPLYP